MKTKVCTKCKKELPATVEYFKKDTRIKSGITAQCKRCISEYKKEYYIENREEICKKVNTYRQNNPEKIKTRKRKYYIENKDKILAISKQWREENQERKKEMDKLWRENNKEHLSEYGKKYREENSESIAKWKRKWYFRNKDKVIKGIAEWNKENPERLNLYQQRRRARRRKLPASLTNNDWEQIIKDFDSKCAYCGKEDTLEQDHFIALTKNGEYTHNNIIPACRSCNASKSNSDFFEWYPSYEHYNEERENKILEYLNYKDNGIQQLSIL